MEAPGTCAVTVQALLTAQPLTFVLMSCKCVVMCFPGVADAHGSLKLSQKPLKEIPPDEDVNAHSSYILITLQ